jgi:hypothetical protein
MGVGPGIGEVIEGDHLKLSRMVLIDCPEDLPPDPAKAVDTDLCCHFALLFFILMAILLPLAFKRG